MSTVPVLVAVVARDGCAGELTCGNAGLQQLELNGLVVAEAGGHA